MSKLITASCFYLLLLHSTDLPLIATLLASCDMNSHSIMYSYHKVFLNILASRKRLTPFLSRTSSSYISAAKRVEESIPY